MNGKWITAHWFALLMSLVILVAVGARVWGFGSVPGSLYWDEVAMLVDARSIAATGKDMHGLPLSLLLPSYGDYKLPVYTWLSTPITLLAVSPEAQIRLISLLAGLGSVLISGLLAVELVSPKDRLQRRVLFLSVLFVTAILPWSIHFSKVGFEGHLAQFLVALSLYCVLLARRRPWMLLVAGLIGVLGLFTYYSVRFVWPVMAVATWLYVWRLHTMVLKKWLLLGVGMLFLFGMGFLAMANSEWYGASQQFRLSSPSLLSIEPFVQEQNVAREAAGNGLISRILLHRSVFQAKALLANVAAHLSPVYLFVCGDSNLRHGTGFNGLGYLTMLPLLVLGVYWAIRSNSHLAALLGVWWLISLIPASVPLEAPHALRSLNALMPFSIFIGFGLAWILNRRNTFLSVFVCGLLLLHLWQFLGFYNTTYAVNSLPAWQAGYKDVAISLYEQHKGVDQAWMSIDDRWYLWYLVYGEKDIAFAQSLQTKDFKPSQLGDNIQLNSWPSLTNFVAGKTYILAGSEEKVNNTLDGLDVEVVFNDSSEGLRVVKFIYASK